MMVSLDFWMGFMCCGLIGFIYLLYQLLLILREFLILLKEELSNNG